MTYQKSDFDEVSRMVASWILFMFLAIFNAIAAIINFAYLPAAFSFGDYNRFSSLFWNGLGLTLVSVCLLMLASLDYSEIVGHLDFARMVSYVLGLAGSMILLIFNLLSLDKR